MENRNDSKRFTPTVEDILEYMNADFVAKHRAGQGAAWSSARNGTRDSNSPARS